MPLTSAAAILALPSDIEIEEVPVPEWKDSVFIKALSGAERDAFEMANRKKGVADLRNYRARFLVRCIVNENGTRVFTDAQAADLGRRSSKVLDRLYNVAGKLSGTDDETEAEIEGNSGAETSETADGSDSPSPSPVTSA